MGLFTRLFGKRKSGPVCAAVVAAAGSSKRMGEDKLFLPLGETPVILRTLQVLESCPSIAEIIVVTREESIVPIGQLCKDAGLTKVTKLILGGETRTQSVLNGVREADPASEVIAIHDAARPLVTAEIVEEAIAGALERGAAAPAVPVKDTIKRVVEGKVDSTPDRSELYAVQTPQVFEHGLILGALQKAVADGVSLTDDCAAVERIGMPVVMTEGSYENLKLTTPEDVTMAEAILARRDAL